MDVREQMKLQQWAADMAEKEASGLTAAQWCEMKGITENCFYYRCKRVRTAMQEMADAETTKELMVRSSRQPSTDFAKIELIAPNPIPTGSSGIDIKLQGMEIHIHPDAKPAQVLLVNGLYRLSAECGGSLVYPRFPDNLG